MKDSYSHDAIGGHLVKSRAQLNFIIHNRLTNGTRSSASYELDLPNGGLSYVVGNHIEKSIHERNTTLISYGSEGLVSSSDQLFLLSNVLISFKPLATFVAIAKDVSTPAIVANNYFIGKGVALTQPTAVETGNVMDVGVKLLGRPLAKSVFAREDESITLINSLLSFDWVHNLDEYISMNRTLRDTYRVIPPEIVELLVILMCSTLMAIVQTIVLAEPNYSKINIFGSLLITYFAAAFLSYLLVLLSAGSGLVWVVAIPAIFMNFVRKNEKLFVIYRWQPALWLPLVIAYGLGILAYCENFEAMLVLLITDCLILYMLRVHVAIS